MSSHLLHVWHLEKFSILTISKCYGQGAVLVRFFVHWIISNAYLCIYWIE